LQTLTGGGEDACKTAALAGIFAALTLTARALVSFTAISYPQPTHLSKVIHWPHMLVENDAFEQVYWGNVLDGFRPGATEVVR
jgi:hypothetical protein